MISSTETRQDYFIGAFVAEGVVAKIMQRNSRVARVALPTPNGTAYIRSALSPSENVKQICRDLDAPSLSVANWLKRFVDDDGAYKKSIF